MNNDETLIGKTLQKFNFSRRNFLKATATLGSVSALAACSKSDGDGETVYIKEPSSPVWVEESIRPAICRPNCFSSCYLNAHVRNGKVVKISRRSLPSRDYERVCLRGLSHTQRIYDSTRLLYPLKRNEASPRGNPTWDRISWEEAITYITDKMKEIRADVTLGDSSIAHLTGSANYAVIQKSLMSKFFNCINATSIAPQLDFCQAVGMSRALGVSTVFPFMQSNEPKDYRNAKTIIAWGSNVSEAQVQSWHFIADAIVNNGAKLISIDVMLSSTAARADHFVHLVPGTDALLALSMVHEIMHNHGTKGSADCWIDYEFIEKNTVAPFIVDEVGGIYTGDFVRYGALTSAEQLLIVNADASTAADALIAYDATLAGFVATVSAGAYLKDKPMLPTGTDCQYEGVPALGTRTVKTAFELLKDKVATYDAATTSADTGVDADVVKKLTEIYCTNGVASIITGFAPDHYSNGHHLYHTLTTLAAITGQIGKPGASVGMWIQFASSNSSALSKRPAELPPVTKSPSIPFPVFPDVFNTTTLTPEGNGGPNELFMGTSTKVRAVWMSWANPLATFVDPNSLRKMFTEKVGSEYKVKLVATIDTQLTDSAEYCDIVLPLTHLFEQEDIVSNGNHPHMSYQPKVIDAPGECKTDSEVGKLLAEAMGFGEYFKQNFEEMADTLVSPDYYKTYHKGVTGYEPKQEELFTWSRLKNEGSLRNFPGSPSKPYVYPMHREAAGAGEKVDNMVFGTQTPVISANTKRIEFYSPFIFNGGASYGQTYNKPKEVLPDYEPPLESLPGQSDYPLQLISERQRWRVHSQWSKTPWLREFDPYPTIKISKEDAVIYGNLLTGDLVKVENNYGNCIVRVIVSIGLRKGVVNVPRGWHLSQVKELFGADADSSQTLTARAIHPVHASQSFYDARVKITKITG